MPLRNPLTRLRGVKLQHGSGGVTGRAILGVTIVTWLAACGGAPRAPATGPVKVTWVVGQAMPAFDPLGPPQPVRAAIERLLSRGLVEEDSTGRVVLAAAESVAISPDRLVYRFTLRPDLSFRDGSPCRSEAFRAAIEAGLNRLDHATYAWLFGSLQGMKLVRAGRPLPLLGIANPDPRTLVLTLAHPDSLFLRKLAQPGAAVPWRSESGGWSDGIGDYVVAGSMPQRLTLARRAARRAGPDSIQIRFVPAAARIRALLRASAPDLVWPPPPDLLDQGLPAGYRALVRPAQPPRRLLLVLRADLPPTSKAPARHALASGLHRGELLDQLGLAAEERSPGLSGAPPYDFPKDDPEQVRDWLDRGKLGRSLHVVMAYSADGPGAKVARTLQSEWAQNALDLELRPVREPEVSSEMLRRGGAQLLLVEDQASLANAAAEMARVIEPLRGPPVGAYRTGWSTREFDAWIAPWASGAALDAAAAQQRLTDEHVVLPIANLPWVWVQRASVSGRFHPRFGPDPRAFALSAPAP